MVDELHLKTIMDLMVDNAIKNLVNGKTGILVDTQSIESTYTEVIDDNRVSDTLIEVNSGERVVIHDVFLTANANLGEVALDFEEEGAIARLYSSQFHRVAFSNMTIQGDEGESVEITGDASSEGDEVFVTINYVIEEVGD